MYMQYWYYYTIKLLGWMDILGDKIHKQGVCSDIAYHGYIEMQHTHMNTHTHTHMRAHTHTHTHVRAHTYTHTHTINCSQQFQTLPVES